jgi:hypothetical protein
MGTNSLIAGGKLVFHRVARRNSLRCVLPRRPAGCVVRCDAALTRSGRVGLSTRRLRGGGRAGATLPSRRSGRAGARRLRRPHAYRARTGDGGLGCVQSQAQGCRPAPTSAAAEGPSRALSQPSLRREGSLPSHPAFSQPSARRACPTAHALCRPSSPDRPAPAARHGRTAPPVVCTFWTVTGRDVAMTSSFLSS